MVARAGCPVIRPESGRGNTMYDIIRQYEAAGISRRVIRTGLTLAEAQAHCQDPETSSATATGKVAKARTRRIGRWFDSYERA